MIEAVVVALVTEVLAVALAVVPPLCKLFDAAGPSCRWSLPAAAAATAGTARLARRGWPAAVPQTVQQVGALPSCVVQGSLMCPQAKVRVVDELLLVKSRAGVHPDESERANSVRMCARVCMRMYDGMCEKL